MKPNYSPPPPMSDLDKLLAIIALVAFFSGLGWVIYLAKALGQ